MSKGKSLVVKKVKKVTASGHHGGAWKVAYADFVTAMMAFFLLLWLISMVAPEKRARVSAYFKNFSIYDQGGTSFMDKSSEIFAESGETSQKALQEMYATTIMNMKQMEEELKKGLMKELGDAKDQVIVDTVDGGVRIQMTDKDGSLMFELGSNRLTPKAREILRIIGDNIKGLPNLLAIEGHTDSLQYAGNDYSNWELSTERASSARKELEANGLKPERVIRVSGFADKDPLITDNPSDPRNRRISIILKAPFIDVNVSPNVKNEQAAENKSPIQTRRKDEGDVMVEKFEENLSLIKSGMNTVQKNIEDKASHDKSTQVNVTKKEAEKSESKSWGPVIKKDDWNPIIKDELKPVIQKNTQTEPLVVPSEKQTESRPRNVVIPADILSSEKNQTLTSSSSKKNEVHIPVIKAPQAEPKETSKEQAIIKEFQSPVLSEDVLGPVISK